MRGNKHLEYLSDRHALVTLAYLRGVHIQVETILIKSVVWMVALWTWTAIYCRIQLSFPWTCRYRSLQKNKPFLISGVSGCDFAGFVE
jgi:hypothetical protein